MHKLELIEHIPGGDVHTLLFTDDVKLTMADLKPTKWGDRRAKVEGWQGDTHACAYTFTLGDPDGGGKFIHYASQRMKDIDWYEVLRMATATIERRLSGRNDGVDREVSWKSARDLMKKQFPKVKEIVPGILPVGATILASSPKLGKSRFMLDISIAVTGGGKALGSIDVEKGDVLYLCLEDSEQLLQERFADMLQGAEMPDGLDYADEWRRFDEGGLEDIERWLQAHPHAKLVVVDIFQRVKGRGRGHRNAYELDYAASAGVLDLSKRYLNVAIAIVHHTNKAKDVQDTFDLISGSRGLLGGVDGGMVMKAVPGHPGEATLEVSHRRLKVSPPKMALKTDTRTGGWALLGEAKQVLLSEERQAIIDLMAQSNAPVSYKLVALELSKPVDAVRMCMGRMAKDGQLIPTGKGGYTLPTPVHVVQSVHAVHPVQAVQIDREQARTGVNTPLGSPQRAHQQGIYEMSEQANTQNSRSNNTPVHSIPLPDLDMLDVFDAVDVTPIGDEHPDDMLNAPRDPTADISPAQHRAELTSRVHKVATEVRPKPLADTQKMSRAKAAGPTTAPWLFGHWTVKNALPSDEPASRADAIGEHRTNGVGGHDDVEVF
jgi:hypothetical protein